MILIPTQPVEEDRKLLQCHERERLKWTIARKHHHYPNYQHLVHLAKMEFEDQRYEQAVAYAQQAIAMEESALVPFKILAFALLHTSHYVEAAHACERYLEGAPEDKETKQALLYCRQMSMRATGEGATA